MARQRFSDDDDYDRRDRRRDDDYDDRRRDDDYDDRPTRRDRDEDDYDDRPRRLTKPGLATAAGVLWVIWGGFDAIGVILAAINLANVNAAFGFAGAFGMADPDITRQLTMLGAFRLIVNLAATVLFLLAGIRTLSGGARSLGGFGIMSIVLCVVTVIYSLAAGYVLSNLFGRMGGPFGGGGRSDAFIYGSACGGGLLGISGALLAAIFAMSCNGNYMKWWNAARGRGSRY